MENFQRVFDMHTMMHFGSGFVWLVQDARQRLQVVSSFETGNPLVPTELLSAPSLTGSSSSSSSSACPVYAPLLALSVWEHAYLPTHGLDRQPYLESFWKNVHWQKVEEHRRSSL